MEELTNKELLIILHNNTIIEDVYNNDPILMDKYFELINYILNGGKNILFNEETNLYEIVSQEKMDKVINGKKAINDVLYYFLTKER